MERAMRGGMMTWWEMMPGNLLRINIRTGIVFLQRVGGADGPSPRKAAVVLAAFALMCSCHFLMPYSLDCR